MDPLDRFQACLVTFWVVTVGHAVATWPVDAVVVLFGGGVCIAFAAEVIGRHLGLVEHALTPTLAGVPLAILLGWPAVVYFALRLSLLLVPPGLLAAALTAVVATALDGGVEPVAVADGVWSYPAHPLSDPRIAGVPWWNAVGWFLIAFLTAGLTLTVS